MTPVKKTAKSAGSRTAAAKQRTDDLQQPGRRRTVGTNAIRNPLACVQSPHPARPQFIQWLAPVGGDGGPWTPSQWSRREESSPSSCCARGAGHSLQAKELLDHNSRTHGTDTTLAFMCARLWIASANGDGGSRGSAETCVHCTFRGVCVAALTSSQLLHNSSIHSQLSYDC